MDVFACFQAAPWAGQVKRSLNSVRTGSVFFANFRSSEETYRRFYMFYVFGALNKTRYI